MAVTPDLTALGKVIGGGMPVAAFGGKREIMQHIAPVGAVYQAGTLSGNPLAMAAGLTTLELIAQPGFYQMLADKTQQLVNGLVKTAKQAGVPLSGVAVGGMFGLFFTDSPQVTSFAEVEQCNVERFKQFFHGMLAQGIYLAPSAFEAGFVSAAHSDVDMEATWQAAEVVFAEFN